MNQGACSYGNAIMAKPRVNCFLQRSRDCTYTLSKIKVQVREIWLIHVP